MITDRKKQILILDGKPYTASEIHELACQGSIGTENAEAYRDLFLFLEQWFDSSPYLRVHTSGSTGKPKEQFVEKSRMIQSACMTCEYLNLQQGDTALLCMNLRYIGAMMMVVRALVSGLNLTVCNASGHPFDTQPSVHFTAMVPLQVYNTLQKKEERAKFKNTSIVLVGGGPVSLELEEELRDFPNAVYSTYGMTETLSHIALRRLSGSLASERYYPFSSVHLSLSPDETLVIDAPFIAKETLSTNDIARIYADGSFVILGRKDNTINTGGIKIQAEQIEKKLSTVFSTAYAITSVPDPKLGEKIVLLVERFEKTDDIETKIKNLLPPYERPKQILYIDILPLTENGKINRAACKKLAEIAI